MTFPEVVQGWKPRPAVAGVMDYESGVRPCEVGLCSGRSLSRVVVSLGVGSDPQIRTSRLSFSTFWPDSRAILQREPAKRLAGTSSATYPSPTHSIGPIPIVMLKALKQRLPALEIEGSGLSEL